MFKVRTNTLFAIRRTDGKFLRVSYDHKNKSKLTANEGWWDDSLDKARLFKRRSDAGQTISRWSGWPSSNLGVPVETVPLTAIAADSQVLLANLLADLQHAFEAGFKACTDYDFSHAPDTVGEFAEFEWKTQRARIIDAARVKVETAGDA